MYFNPRSPHGERPFDSSETTFFRLISIHAPRMGSDLPRRRQNAYGYISIHAPRMGSDDFREQPAATWHRFQSTLPAWGATCQYLGRNFIGIEFQSTLPAWGATSADRAGRIEENISIHAPRMGSDRQARRMGPERNRKFQSTLPAWGATKCWEDATSYPRISIHAPRMGNAIKLSKILIAHASNSVCFFMPFSSQLTIK